MTLAFFKTQLSILCLNEIFKKKNSKNLYVNKRIKTY